MILAKYEHRSLSAEAYRGSVSEHMALVSRMNCQDEVVHIQELQILILGNGRMINGVVFASLSLRMLHVTVLKRHAFKEKQAFLYQYFCPRNLTFSFYRII